LPHYRKVFSGVSDFAITSAHGALTGKRWVSFLWIFMFISISSHRFLIAGILSAYVNLLVDFILSSPHISICFTEPYLLWGLACLQQCHGCLSRQESIGASAAIQFLHAWKNVIAMNVNDLFDLIWVSESCIISLPPPCGMEKLCG
jgi:hypothetical protein